MACKLNYDRAARILAEAAMFGDTRTAEKNGVTLQTLRNYRKRAETDGKLLQLLAREKEVLSKRWADDLVPAIRGAIDFIKRACQEADPKDYNALHSVNGSLKILSEVAMGERMLDARLSGEDRNAPAADGPLATEEENSEGQPH
jgi:hypothetical protein